VLGAVNKPGVQVLQGRKVLLEVLSMAGGILPEAGYSLMVTRKVEQGELPLPKAALDPTGKFYIAEVNLNEILNAKKPELNIQVQPDDTISVPRGELVYAIGEVKKAGGFVLNEKMTVSVLKVLALAEGLTPVAAPKAAQILREGQGASRQEIPINLKDIMSGKTKDVALMPNDILFVPKNVAKGVMGKIGETALNAVMYSAIYRVP
jgi:polysaccharide export outer membrane protein